MKFGLQFIQNPFSPIFFESSSSYRCLHFIALDISFSHYHMILSQLQQPMLDQALILAFYSAFV